MRFRSSAIRRKSAIYGGVLVGLGSGLVIDALLLIAQKVANFALTQGLWGSIGWNPANGSPVAYFFNPLIAIAIPAVCIIPGFGLGLIGAALIPSDPLGPQPPTAAVTSREALKH